MISTVFLWTLFWACYYFIVKKYNSNRSKEWSSRIVAATHALIVTKLLDTCLITGYWVFDHLGDENTTLQYISMSISAGYFLFETSWCFYMGTESSLMIVHHVISLACLIGGLWMGKCGAEITAGIWGSELTNPFLQIRWFLRETGSYYTTFGKLNDFVFVLLFGFVRIVIGGYLIYYHVYVSRSPILMKTGGIVFYIIGVIWMCQILRFAEKRFITGSLKEIKKNGSCKSA